MKFWLWIERDSKSVVSESRHSRRLSERCETASWRRSFVGNVFPSTWPINVQLYMCGCIYFLYVSFCTKEKANASLLCRSAKWGKQEGTVAIFHLSPTYYLISLGTDALSAHWPDCCNLENEPTKTLLLANTIAASSSFSNPVHPYSISLGPAADRCLLRREFQKQSGLLFGTFQRYNTKLRGDKLRRDQHLRIERN